MSTLICQSARRKDAPGFLLRCLESVETFASTSGYQYVFEDDRPFFGRVPTRYIEQAQGRTVVVSDLARLLWMRALLEQGVERVVWLDADVLVFGPLSLDAPEGYAFGRERFVQPTAAGGLKVHKNAHNAVCVFAAQNPMLDFYIHACQRIVARADGQGPAQIVGPKFLTALSNMLHLPLLDEVGSLSPPVLRDLAARGGPAWDALRAEPTDAPLGAANLCASYRGQTVMGVDVNDALFDAAIDRLLDL